MLGNVRRLYRTRPQAGAEAVDSLMRYLRTALPQLRSARASFGDEIALVRAYLELFQLRMGRQLAFAIEVDPALQEVEFPPMLLVTLVENAIKHGLEPMGGGRVEVHAQRRRGMLEAIVLDDGAGFGATATSGTGVGLANVRRRLAARYQDRARLALEAREPRGARVSIVIPLHAVQPAECALKDLTEVQPAGGFARWLRTHRGAAAMAGLLAFAAPLTFFTGALSVARPATGVYMAGMWWMLYGTLLWVALLVAGYACERLIRGLGRYLSAAVWLLGACAAAAFANILTAGRTTILIEQGLVHSVRTAYLYAFTFSLIMALLYFAHLHRSRQHEQAAARLAAAQAAQRHARRRTVQARQHEVQARIDPQLLFEMLDHVRRWYDRDAARAECLLEELIGFLRAALPRLRSASSSLAREAQLAHAFVRLHALAGPKTLGMAAAVAPDALHARFPPGVLLPLLDGAVRGGGPIRLAATRSGEGCRLVLTLAAAPPSQASMVRVRSLLAELYGSSSALAVERTTGGVHVRVEVPYELA
jgi:LytS/YehU family sensor histidine kinase